MDPGDVALVAAHLDWLRLRGLAASMVRRRRVVLGWVADSLDSSLLEASAADLRRWRASLQVSTDAAAVYISHVTQFYRWALDQGLIAGSASRGPVGPVIRKRPAPGLAELKSRFKFRCAWLVPSSLRVVRLSGAGSTPW